MDNNQKKYESITYPDKGPHPASLNIESAINDNSAFRRALWTGNNLQMTAMNVQDEIGAEIHPDTDQYLQVISGEGILQMGRDKDNINLQRLVNDGTGIFIPAGTWHNLKNNKPYPLKLFSIYAPSHHPHGTVHYTKAEADKAEHY